MSHTCGSLCSPGRSTEVSVAWAGECRHTPLLPYKLCPWAGSSPTGKGPQALAPHVQRPLPCPQIIKQSITELRLQAEDSFVLKVVQLEELLQVRHSVFVIGSAGSGKSQARPRGPLRGPGPGVEGHQRVGPVPSPPTWGSHPRAPWEAAQPEVCHKPGKKL